MRDNGVTIMEIVMGMSIFAVVAASSAVLLLKSGETVRSNEERVVAASVLNNYLEEVRAKGAESIADSQVITTVDVDGKEFTVQQDSEYVANVAGDSLCETDTVTMAYRVVRVQVTWDFMNGVAPVVGDTALSYKPGTYESPLNTGHIALQVTQADGSAAVGAKVTAIPEGGTSTHTAHTDQEGCATLINLPAAPAGTSYNITVEHSEGTFEGGGQVKHIGPLVLQPNTVLRHGGVKVDDALYWELDTRPVPLKPGVGQFWLEIAGSGISGNVPPCSTAQKGQICLDGFPGRLKNIVAGTYRFGLSNCPNTTPVQRQNMTVADVQSGSGVQLKLAEVTVQTRKENGGSAPNTIVRAQPVCQVQTNNGWQRQVIESVYVDSAPTKGNGTVMHLPAGEWKLTQQAGNNSGVGWRYIMADSTKKTVVTLQAGVTE